MGDTRRPAATESDPAPDRTARRPRRTLPVPIHSQRHLLPGWEALRREGREGWRARELAVPDGRTLADLAWYACDGRRTMGEIARLVWLETGRDEPAFIDAFFALTESLGLSERASSEEAACRPVAPDTATR